MAGEGYGGGSWGGAPWGGASPPVGGGGEEHIPKTRIWNAFDLQPVDMDRVPAFIEVSTFGQATQFFLASFNICSGGAYSTDEAILDINVPVLETFTVEFLLKFNELPPSWDDVVNEHVLLGVNGAASVCSTFLFSQDGVAYTGALHFAGAGNTLTFDHLLNPGGITAAERHLQRIPGSSEWFKLGVEYVVRFISDYAQGLVYFYLTRADELEVTGHVLRALLPPLLASTATYPAIDRIAVAVRGSSGNASCLELFTYTKSYSALIPNLPPRAIISGDQAVRMCSIVQLDGSASFDPEGAELGYDWRLIDAPETSQFAFAGADGYTQPAVPPTGYTRRFFSPELGLENTVAVIHPGDVLMVGAAAYSIATIPPGNTVPFYVDITKSQLPDDLVNAAYKLLRQSSVMGADTAKPTFYPDVAGFYLFDLRVFDGAQWSSPTGLQRATTLVNVLESPLPRACTPNLNFIFDYLSDFWKMVEDVEVIEPFWAGLAQVAATELFTLWQHEYSKSIRDVQRTFTRRWLHYDLLLGEPLPELTKTFPVFGGVDSTPFTTATVQGQVLVLSSPGFSEPRSITFRERGYLDPQLFADGLGRQLRQYVSPYFGTQLIRKTDGSYIIRIDAPFEFAVAAGTTTPLFSVGDVNTLPLGTGYATSARAFKVDRSLAGLALVEAFLVVGENTYVIERVVSDSSDAFPYQRVVLREELDVSIPRDAGLPPASYAICGWVSSELLDFYNGLVTRGDYIDVEVVESNPELSSLEQYTGIIETRAYGASPTFNGRCPIDFGPIGHFIANAELTVRLARVLRRGRVPVDALVLDIPTLQEHIVIKDDTATLRRNLDFYIEEHRGRNSVRFVAGQYGGPDVFETARPPDRLWAEYTYLDNVTTIEDNFGGAVGFTREELSELPDTVDYLSAVSGLLFAYSNGPTVSNLRIGTQILLGLPFAEEEGTIEELRADLLGTRGRILIRDSANAEVVRSYSYPKSLALEMNPSTGVAWAVGDTVTRFAPLVVGAEVIDYVKDPAWFEGLLNQGVFHELQKFHTFVVRADSRAFNLSALLTARNFILRIKPTYTQPLFVVQLLVSDEDGDEISVNDTVTYSGTLRLDDAVCAGRIGASNVIDQPWPGGGQPWAGDSSTDFGPWRNRVDNDDDHNTPAVYPIAETVYWGVDKLWLCPHDSLAHNTCVELAAPSLPSLDSVFKFDTPYNENFATTEAGPITVPSGSVGHVFTLTPDNFVNQAGTLTRGSLQLLGVTGTGEATFELVLTNVTQATSQVVAVTAATNTERVFTLSLAVASGDQLQVSLRTVSRGAATPGWTRILLKFGAGALWAVDTLLPAGTYCGSQELVA